MFLHIMVCQNFKKSNAKETTFFFLRHVMLKYIGCKWDNMSHNYLLRGICLGGFFRNIVESPQKNLFKSSIFSLHYYVKVYVKISRNISFKKVLNPIDNSFLCLKTNITMYNECF
jgi:hypothetical protein